MKTKSILLSLAAIATGICAYAQENDDMYFTSRDRAKINLRSREETVMASAKSQGTVQTINPSDSYSGRNENPDYVAGTKVGSNATANSSYFNSNYQPTVNQNLYGNNCNCSNYNNYSRYGSSYGYGYGSPYYGYGYGYPYSYGSSFGMGYGLGYGSYYGMGYGMYGMYGYPYYGYGYSPYYGYGGYGSYYPSTVVVTGSNDHASPPYGRNSVVSNSTRNSYYTVNKPGRNSAYYNGGSRSASGARVASNQTSQYYSNAWKQSAANNRGSSWHNVSTPRTSWSNSGWSNQGARSWSTPSSNWGGGMRSSGFSGGGGFGGGHSGGGSHVGGGGHGRR